MSATITHISSPQAAGSASGPGIGLKAGAGASAASGNEGGGLSQGLEGLFSALLNFAQQSQSDTASQGAGPFLSEMGIDRSALSKMAVDIGGKIDLSGILTAAGAQGVSDAGTQGATEAGADKAKNPDPLAAIIAGLLAGLQSLGKGAPADTQGNAPVSGEKLVGALSDLLSAIEAKAQAGQAGPTPGSKPFAQLDPAVLDQLKELSNNLQALVRAPGATLQAQGTNGDAPPGQSVKLDAQLMGSLQQISHRIDALLTGTDASARAQSATNTVLAAPNVSSPAALLSPETSAQAASGAAAAANPTPTANKPVHEGKTDAEKRLERVAARAASAAQSPAQSASQTSSTNNAAGANNDALSNLNQLSPQHHLATGANFRPAGFGPQPGQAQVNLPTLAYEFVRQVNAGNTRFEIRLDPAEMGKIDVKIDIDKTGALHARLSVEKAETLDLLQRDARNLERALSQAGLDGAKTNLEFSLKQNPFAGQQFAGHRQGQNGEQSKEWQPDAPLTAIDEPAPAQATQAYRGIATPGGVNLLA